MSELYKVTGTSFDGLKVVRVPPRYFRTKHSAYYHMIDKMEASIVWKANEEGSRNKWSMIYRKNIEWPEGARGLNSPHGNTNKRGARGINTTEEER